MHSFQALTTTFAAHQLFDEKTWRVSPAAFPLTAAQLGEIKRIGDACHAFYHAQELLYTRSSLGKKILRNGGSAVPWVAKCLDRGKPAGLVAHGLHRSVKNLSPAVLRPDLLITENGFSLTEMDSVPGGVGLTAFLNETYAPLTPDIVGGATQPELFYQHLAALAKNTRADSADDDGNGSSSNNGNGGSGDNGDGGEVGALPLIAIVVSDEAATYRPEFVWLAEKLRAQGRRVHCVHPSELMPLGGGIFIPVDGAPQRVDVIYRFFELFDLGDVKGADAIFDAVENGQVVLTPPMKAFQEEKLNLALLHHPALDAFWRENLPAAHLDTLRRVVPRTWLMEENPLPPTAVLHAPAVGGRPVCSWAELANASQRERNLIIKASGFDATAWGARSVTLGSDVSREEWLAAIEDATDAENETFYIMQDYHKPVRLRHPVYRDDGSVAEEEGRVRLCPFFFAGPASGTPVEMGAILATFCPADKKIIHGMKDAALMPCALAAPKS
ncbi:MAG: hypothetical protein LBT53_09670 [Puniceicoccales bacterium]|jgi:hypothetical protein|nr:hypothetical protein [Puniceicoccales bacterium]